MMEVWKAGSTTERTKKDDIDIHSVLKPLKFISRTLDIRVYKVSYPGKAGFRGIVQTDKSRRHFASDHKFQATIVTKVRNPN